MKVFSTKNHTVAVEPFPAMQAVAQVKGGFAVASKRDQLVRLRVVFTTRYCQELSMLHAGDYVWVSSSYQDHQDAKKVYEVDGKKFVAIPSAWVTLAEFDATSPPPMPDDMED